MLKDAKKPLIGHNPMYDIAFLYEQFIEPLPDSFIEFCCKWKENFPVIYDTKVLYQLVPASEKRYVISILDNIFKIVQVEKQYSSNLTF